jgi:ADP-heptose:LPS heptosyltransferase
MEIRNIIVSRTDKIGDLVLSIPSFYMIKKMYPNSKLTVLVRNYNYDVVKNLSYIDEVIKIDDYDEESLENKIKDINADIFVALYSDKRVAKLARVSKAKWRVGPFSKIESFFSYNKGLWQKRSKSIKNEAEYNLDLVRSIDSKLYEEKLDINTKIIYDKGHEKMAQDWLQLNNIDKFILIHPFSGGSAKNITDNQYSQLIERILKEKSEYKIIIS